MQHLTSMYDSEGQIYDLPSDKVDAFREKRGGERALDYRLPDGREYSIPESQATRFAEVHPDAQPMRSLTFANGSTRRFTSSELRDFMTREYRESDDYKADRDASAARAKEIAPDVDKPTEVAGDSAAEDMLWAARRGRDYVAGKFVGGLSHVFTGAMRLADSAAKAFGTKPFFDNKEIADSIDKALAPTKEEAEAVGAPVRAAGAVAGTAGNLLTWDRAFSGLGFWGGNALMTAEAGNDAYLSTFDAGIASGKTPEEADAIAKKSGVAATATTALYGLAIRSLGNLFSGKTTVGADSFKDVKVPNYDLLVKAVQRGELMKYIKNGLAASAGAGAAGGAGDYFQTVYGKEAMGDEANWTDPEAWWNAAKGFATAFGLTGALAGFGYKQFKNAVYDAVEAQARAAATTPETRAAWREMFPEGTRNVIAKRALGKDISRSDIKNAGFPEMSLKERNAVGDAMLRDYMEAKKGKTPPKQLTDGTQPPAADTGTQPIEPTEPPKLPTETTTKEKPNETGNVPDEKPAQPKPPVEARAEGAEAVRPVEGTEAPAEAPNAGVVEPRTSAKPAEVAQKPAPDGKGRMVKPSANSVKDKGNSDWNDKQEEKYSKFASTVADATVKYNSEDDVGEVSIGDKPTRLTISDWRFFGDSEDAVAARYRYDETSGYEWQKFRDLADEWNKIDAKHTAEHYDGDNSMNFRSLKEAIAFEKWIEGKVNISKPVPDGKGKMVKPEKPASKPSGEQWTKEQYEERKNLIATGKPVSVAGFPKGEAFAVKRGRNWVVIDGKSGLRFGMGRTRKDAMADAETNLKNHTKEQIRQAREMGSSYFNTARDTYEPKADNPAVDAELRKGFDKTVKSALSQEGRPIDNLHDAAERLTDTIKDKYDGDANAEKALDKALADFKENHPLGRGIKPSESAEYFKEFADELAKKYEIPGYDGKVEAPKYGGREMKVGNVDSIQKKLFELRGEYADTSVIEEGAFDELPFREIDAEKLSARDLKELKGLEKAASDALFNIDADGIEFEKSGVLADESRKLVDAYTEARDNLNRFLEQADRYQHLKRDKKGRPLFSRAPEEDASVFEPEAKSPEQEIEERLDLKRIDPKRRSDPKVLEWAKRNGRKPTDGKVTPDAVRAYDEAMTEGVARLAKRWFPDMKIVAHKYGEKIKRGVHVIEQKAEEANGGAEISYLRDTSGGVLGWFDPKSKEVHLLPGADPRTVAHEIMWHGTRDYISQLAAKGDARAQRFLDMMHDVEKNIPEPLKKKIIAIYTKGTKAPTSDTLMNEFGAWFTMEKGGKALEDAMTTAEGRNWFAKALYAVKEVYKDFLAKHGGNRVDLSEVDGMARDEFVDFLAKEFAGGKTLGEITGKTNELSTKETKFQAFRRKVYDNNAPVRDLERDIEKKTGKKISADDSVEAANALKYGLKEAANIEIQGKMADFRKTLGESGIHYEDLEYYAALKAAAGRDAKIDKRNIDKLTEDMKKAGASAQDIADAIADYKSTNGSHIDPREAKKMLAEIENGPDAAKYKAAYDKLRAIIDETLDTQVAAGLVDAKDAAQWRAEEPNYVPFKNEYDPESGDWEGRGTSRNFVQPEHRMAKGRQSAAGDIIAHIFMDHQAAKHRAIENGVRKRLAELVRANPEIGKVELLRKESVKNIEKDDPNVVVFKDGGRSYAIRLNGTRGAAIANAFTQRNLVKMEWADKGFEVFGKKISFRNFAHWSSGMATRYSPTFAIRNTTKDNIELANIVYSERGPIEGTKFMASYAANRAKMAPTLAKYVATGKIDTSTTEGQILDRYIKAGGLIAGGVRAEGMDSIKAKLSPKAIAKEMKHGKSRLVAAGKHVVNSIAYLNEYAEMATRVGVFATEVKAGKSDAEAALFSRRATVDFNRHGDYTPAFNVFRLFSNSTLGATARAAAALGKSKYGKYAALAMFVNGLAQALIEYFYNQDEDKRREKTGEATGKDVSEFDRKTSLFYFRDGDEVYKVAQHESPFSLLTYAGNSVGRWLCGEIDGADVARNLGVSTAELAYNFLPMGQINLQSRKGGFVNDLHAALVSGICPSVLQPIAELAWNVDFKGDTVLRETMNAYDPKSHNGKEHTPEWAKQSAEWLNDSTGGNAGRRGFVDIAPEAIQKLVEGYGKNALRDVSAAYSVGKAIADGDISGLDPRNTPVKRDFVRPLDGNDRRFNDALSQYKADKNEVSKMKDAWTDEELSAYEDAHPWVADAEVKNAVSEIQKLRKMEQGFSYETGKATPYEWSKEEIEEFKKERRELQAFVLEKMRK